jgi:hypothetical protein
LNSGRRGSGRGRLLKQEVPETSNDDRAHGKEHYLGGHQDVGAEGDEMNAKYCAYA